MKNIKTIKKAILDFISFYNNKKLGEYSAQASYYMILSFFPFIMLLLTLVRFLPIRYEEVIAYFFSFLSSDMRDFLKNIIDEIFIRTTTEFTIVTAVVTLWAASKSVSSIMRGLNNMFECKETRGFIITKINALVNTLLLVFMMTASMVIMVFGDQIEQLINRFFPVAGIIFESIVSMRTLLFFCILIIFNMIMYKMLPNRNVPLLWQFPGACFSTVGWYIFTMFFQIYVKHAGNYYVMYGSITAIIFAIVWVYACMHIFYIGAGVNLYFERHFYSNQTGSGIEKV